MQNLSKYLLLNPPLNIAIGECSSATIEVPLSNYRIYPLKNYYFSYQDVNDTYYLSIGNDFGAQMYYFEITFEATTTTEATTTAGTTITTTTATNNGTNGNTLFQFHLFH